MTLKIWKCKKCEEEFWYRDENIKEVQCKCGEWMELVEIKTYEYT